MSLVHHENLKPVAIRLRIHADSFRERVNARFFREHPTDRQLFPVDSHDVHADLPTVLAWTLTRTPVDGALPDQVRTILAQLGRENRRFRMPTAHYGTLARVSRGELGRIISNLPPELVTGADTALAECFGVMAEAAAVEDAAGVPDSRTAEVVEVERRCARVSVVRLLADTPVPYAAGQYLPVTSDTTTRGLWRDLSPAIPANDVGQVEFHVFADRDDTTGRLLATPQPGDRWRIGAPLGRMSVDGSRDILMIAHSTGLAPLRAILLDMVMSGSGGRRTHLFFGADSPGELYDLRGLWELVAGVPWLSVTPVVVRESDPWWVRPTAFSSAPRGLHMQQTGTLAEIVPGYGTWEDRDVLIAGPDAVVADVAAALRAAGTPAENIRHNPA
ncbi:FAD-binding oxidoreductase [Corynebacterium pygosceleis]|uniref:FAD-binding oxidoreductase n=1 Tax=Corynebacterium pygosceleis TaxID=2800406 RepID=UPI002005F37E|nr:FAD-binding oxidoreductase [Corynebacterium pygosceleis]MCK7675308.1 FAD-binding oxidoreductase [Corynebacterium pygosceleis]